MDSVIATGDNTTINQTFVQKVFNFFKPDTETLDQRNRRILLNHVENFWVKGVLEKSLHGAAMLELGIKEDPEAVTYPWAIKKEATGETIPTGTSMLEIFEKIGMGRSLLILGAPGSGKTTMLLELARQLIKRARQNADEPIPMVFNLASWTEKLSLADWLAQELNNIYYVPRKTAPDWVKGNKLLLLLDGLDEVRQESRAKCVEAINGFRKEHGLTSLAVCSRSQDYAVLNRKLSFEGAIEVQPLTQKQVNEFFNRFGKEMAGLKSVLKKDSALLEMAETPLFLSIMVLAYQGKQEVDIGVSQYVEAQRKYLFDNYIEFMFKRPEHSNQQAFIKENSLRWLSWLAQKLFEQRQMIFLVENIKRNWLITKTQQVINIVIASVFSLFIGVFIYLGTFHMYSSTGLALIAGIGGVILTIFSISDEENVEITKWSWKEVWNFSRSDLIFFIGIVTVFGIAMWLFTNPISTIMGIVGGISLGLFMGGFKTLEIEARTRVNQGINLSLRNAIIFGIISTATVSLTGNLEFCLGIGLLFALQFGGSAVTNHYTLRLLLYLGGYTPIHLIPFLDYCADLIFLRRVGGGYIFVHRLLMEHFAAMYEEERP